MLSEQMKLMHETEEDPFTPSNIEIYTARPDDLLIDEDSQDEEDINITVRNVTITRCLIISEKIILLVKIVCNFSKYFEL